MSRKEVDRSLITAEDDRSLIIDHRRNRIISGIAALSVAVIATNWAPNAQGSETHPDPKSTAVDSIGTHHSTNNTSSGTVAVTETIDINTSVTISVAPVKWPNRINVAGPVGEWSPRHGSQVMESGGQAYVVVDGRDQPFSSPNPHQDSATGIYAEPSQNSSAAGNRLVAAVEDGVVLKVVGITSSGEKIRDDSSHSSTVWEKVVVAPGWDPGWIPATNSEFPNLAFIEANSDYLKHVNYKDGGTVEVSEFTGGRAGNSNTSSMNVSVDNNP